MMGEALAGYSALIKVGDGEASEVFTTIAEVEKISGPELELETEDATTFDSGGWEESIGTILKGGKVSMDLNFVPTAATHDPATGLIADMVERTLRNFEIVFPDAAATTWTIAAFITKFAPSVEVKGKLKASVELQISGQPTLA